MLVSDLQQFLLLLLPPLRALGINAPADKSVTKGIEVMANALGPFKDLGVDQFCDLLRAAQEYRETGQLPDWVLVKKPGTPGARKSTPKATKAPKMTKAEALAKLEALLAQAQDLDSERIKNEVDTLNDLNGGDLKDVQKTFLGTAPSGGTKKDRLEAIKRRIFSNRQNKLRSEEILQS